MATESYHFVREAQLGREIEAAARRGRGEMARDSIVAINYLLDTARQIIRPRCRRKRK